MIEFNGNVYLSAYAVPKLADEEQSAGGRYEIAAVLNYLFDNGIWDISSEELTPMVRENYYRYAAGLRSGFRNPTGVLFSQGFAW